MANKEEFPESMPDLQIPDLKKKEKERKKAGAGWGSGRGAGSVFNGAKGASGIARSAASAVARAMGQGAGAGGFGGGLISRLMATLAGKMALAAAAAMALGLGTFLISKVMNMGSGGGDASVDLGALKSTIKVREGGDVSGLKYARNDAGVNFGGSAGKSAASEKTAPVEQSQAAGPVPKTALLDNTNIQAMGQNQLAHDGNGFKLSTALGGASGGGGFGGNDVFKNSSFGHGAFQNKLQGFGTASASTGKGSTSSHLSVHAGTMGLGGKFGSKSSRAFGLLQNMSTSNGTIKNTGTAAEVASQAASDQFNTQTTQGGSAPTAPPSVDPASGSGSGSNGSNGTNGNNGACTGGQIMNASGQCVDSLCPNGDCSAVDSSPWKNDLLSAEGDMDQAKSLLIKASIIYLAAAAIAAALLLTGVGAGAAAAVMATAMVTVLVLANQVWQLGQQVKDLGNKIGAEGSQMIGAGVHDIGNWMEWGSVATFLTMFGGFIIAGIISAKEVTILEEAQGEIGDGSGGDVGSGSGSGSGAGSGSSGSSSGRGGGGGHVHAPREV